MNQGNNNELISCLNCHKNSEDCILLSCEHKFCQKCLKKAWKIIAKTHNNTFCCLLEECERPVGNFIYENILPDKYLKYLNCEECNNCYQKYVPIKFKCQHTFCHRCLKKDLKMQLKKNRIPCCTYANCTEIFNEENLKDIGLSKKYIRIYRENLKNDAPKKKSRILHSNMKESLIEKRSDEILKGKIQCKICLFYHYPKDMILLTCNHKFCTKCLLDDWKYKISSGTFLNCPSYNCLKEINYYLLKDNLPKEDFEKYDLMILTRTMNDVQNNEKVIKCPLKCNVTCLLWKEASNFQCPLCKKTFCSNEECLGEWVYHEKMTCEEFKQNFNFNRKPIDNDLQFENLVKLKKWMNCPKCLCVIEKTKNCNYIRCESALCSRKTVFCYLCGIQLEEKKINEHFYNKNPYNQCFNIKNNKNEVKNLNEKKNLTSENKNNNEVIKNNMEGYQNNKVEEVKKKETKNRNEEFIKNKVKKPNQLIEINHRNNGLSIENENKTLENLNENFREKKNNNLEKQNNLAENQNKNLNNLLGKPKPAQNSPLNEKHNREINEIYLSNSKKHKVIEDKRFENQNEENNGWMFNFCCRRKIRDKNNSSDDEKNKD